MDMSRLLSWSTGQFPGVAPMVEAHAEHCK